MAIRANAMQQPAPNNQSSTNNPHRIPCELCQEIASIYCPSDSAFLCKTCDVRVHTANFLVARHLRFPLSSSTHGDRSDHYFSCNHHLSRTENSNHSISTPTDDITSSKSSSTTEASTTRRGTSDISSSSSSSDRTRKPRLKSVNEELITTPSHNHHQPTHPNIRPRMAVVMSNWCRQLQDHHHHEVDEKSVIAAAIKVLGISLSKLQYIPLRVAVAASFWIGIRITHRHHSPKTNSTTADVRRVEQVTQVPGQMILAMESKLLRLVKRRRRSRRGSSSVEVFQEGWAEC